jgi:hypothetical protein
MAIFLVALSNPSHEAKADVDVGIGDMKIGGILQGQLWWTNADVDNAWYFRVNRARLLFKGSIPDANVKYFIQTESICDPMGTVEHPAIRLLDMKLSTCCIPMTEIAFGRFLPNFTYYMPRHTGMLDMINYPAVVLYYAMWRQIGIQTTTKTQWVDVNLGFFNGGVNNWNWDDTEAKDVFFRATVKPMPIFNAAAYYWMGKDGVDELEKTRLGFLGDLNMGTVEARGEYIMGSDEPAPGADDIKSAGFYVHASYCVMPMVQALFRYDQVDPDTDCDDDEQSWITFGANMFMNEKRSSQLQLNYVAKSEEPDVDNDELIIQWSVMF